MPPFMCFLEPYSSNSGHYQNGDAKSNRPGGYWSPLTARRQFQFDSVYGCAVRCWLIPNAVEIPGIPHEVVCPQQGQVVTDNAGRARDAGSGRRGLLTQQSGAQHLWTSGRVVNPKSPPKITPTGEGPLMPMLTRLLTDRS
jgi:hypothetical protein